MPIDVLTSAAVRPALSVRALAVRLAAVFGGRRTAIVLKLGVSLGLIALVGHSIDRNSLAESLARQSPVWLGVTVLLGLLQIGLLSLRWEMILRALGAGSSLVSAVAVTFMGCFFGSFMFGPTGGDVARAVLAPPRSLGRTRIVHSVLFERFASTAGLGLAAVPVVAFGAATLAHGLPLIVALATVPLPLAAMAAIGWLART